MRQRQKYTRIGCRERESLLGNILDDYLKPVRLEGLANPKDAW